MYLSQYDTINAPWITVQNIRYATMTSFEKQFDLLTGFSPMPWQARLFREHFFEGSIPPSCSIPTGLGKTSIVAVWLSALCHGAKVPRRLIYVVNRRTVVDQTTEEVVRYAEICNAHELFADFRSKFGALKLSTLRGQLADDGEWCEDPSIPAVICGTVDMIGSRLLFSGYGIGRGKRPLHAGFLGQDSLLVHDEAHLEPAFQELIEVIQKQQQQEASVPWPKLKVLALTATSKFPASFQLDEKDYENHVVRTRIDSVKKIALHELGDPKKPAKELAAKALEFKDSGNAILLFVSSVEAVLEIQAILEKAKLAGNIVTLTGTMRGQERDELVLNRTFARYLPNPQGDATAGTVFLICTSAGEVGINISADHMICDLSTFESMAQRLGRVNRFGLRDDSQIHVFHPSEKAWDDKDPLSVPKQKTLGVLRHLLDGNASASPRAIADLPNQLKSDAFAPDPVIPSATERLFDAWCLTSVVEALPGRPPVEPYIHGLTEYKLPETHFAWRNDVELLRHDTVTDLQRRELLDSYPLLPRELLREPSYRAIKHLHSIANRNPDGIAWLIDTAGNVTERPLAFFLDKTNKDVIEGATIVLSPRSGGLNTSGMLAGESANANDVSESTDRVRITDDGNSDSRSVALHEVYSVAIPSVDEEIGPKMVRWFANRNTGETVSKRPVEWQVHVADVENKMREIVSRLDLGDSLNRCLMTAARYHDHGKRRSVFQKILGNHSYPNLCLAKSGRQSGVRIEERYRHEFGSLHDLPNANELGISDKERELVLHLIAAHHGRARPHFPREEVFDPSSTPETDEATAISVPQRYGRLQQKYGRWGLAYLESLLRAADWSASANPSSEV
jgi:CRISPR-associated endonuclease/helicase Cas3